MVVCLALVGISPLGGCVACGLVDAARTPPEPSGGSNEMDADICEFIECPPDAAADSAMDSTADADMDATADGMMDAVQDAEPDSTTDS